MDKIDQLRALLVKTPGDADIMYMLAQEHTKSGEHTAAIAWFDQCLEADPEYCYAYFHKARAQQALGRMGDAKQTLEAGVTQAATLGDGKALGELQDELQELG